MAAKSIRVIVLLVVQMIAIQACRPSSAVFCPVEQLLLDESDFPRGTEAGEVLSPLPDGTIHSGGKTYYLGKGIANHFIYGFSTDGRAADEYDHEQKGSAFSSSNVEWQTPDEVNGLLAASTQHQVVCGTQHQIPMCKVIAQYDNYFIFFNIHMYPAETTVQDLAFLLREIDTRTSQCVYSTPVP